MRAEPLPLTGEPIARGGFRDVYLHPADPALLIKVLRREASARPSIFRRYGVYTPYLREIREYFALRARLGRTPDMLARLHGITETDRGLGMVVERVTQADGALAQTLSSVARRGGMTPELHALLDSFYAAILADNIVVSDLNPRNIVLGDDNGAPRLVLVDGLGEKTLIPARSISRRFNRWQTRRHIERSRDRIRRLEAEAGRADR